MARRVHFLEGLDLGRELKAVRTPTLVITGEPALDRVVPVELTREYLALWPHAQAATIANTGHLGSITRPEAFANLVAPFVAQASSWRPAVGAALQARPRGGIETPPLQPGERRRIG
jgi:pimeloyl-ACP methyl ester carboxylesterase